MSISTVKFTFQGQTYDLVLNSATGKYEATITAPSTTSWHETDHKYYGQVVATDDAGNSTTATKAEFPSLGLRVLEKVKPAITVTYPAASAFISNNKPTLEWNVTDDGSGIDLSTISIKIDGAAAITGSAITTTAITNGYKCTYVPASALGEGIHTVEFAVSDNDGNAAAATTVSFTVDTVPPVLNITAPVDGMITNEASLVVSGSTNDATSNAVVVKIKVNSGAEETVAVSDTGTFSKAVTLTEGENTIVITATDAAGKATSITRTVTLDTGVPVITDVTLTPNPVDGGKTFIVSVTVTD